MCDPQEQAPAIDARAYGVLEDLAGGDLDFLRDVIGQYLIDTARRIGDLVRAAEADDAESLVRAAHSLKSSSANLGALRLSEMADRLQSRGRESRLERTRALALAAQQEFERVRCDLGQRLEKLSG